MGFAFVAFERPVVTHKSQLSPASGFQERNLGEEGERVVTGEGAGPWALESRLMGLFLRCE